MPWEYGGWGGGGGRVRCRGRGPEQTVGEAQGRQLSQGKFPREIPFQELYLLTQAENFKKIKKMWGSSFREFHSIGGPDGWQQSLQIQERTSTFLSLREQACSVVESRFCFVFFN